MSRTLLIALAGAAVSTAAFAQQQPQTPPPVTNYYQPPPQMERQFAREARSENARLQPWLYNSPPALERHFKVRAISEAIRDRRCDEARELVDGMRDPNLAFNVRRLCRTSPSE